VDADRRASFKIPPPTHKSSWFVRVNPGWTDVDKITGKRAFQRTITDSAEVSTIPYLHGPQVMVSSKFLVEPAAPPTMNAPVHFMLNQRSQVLIIIGALFTQITLDPVATGNGHVLKQAVSSLIADRAVKGMIQHKPLNYVPAEIYCFFIIRGHHHSVPGINHAAHLHSLDRTLYKFNRTNSTGAHRPKGRMIAKARNHDAQPFSRFDDFGAFGNVYLTVINNQCGHGGTNDLHLNMD
jgi:hypothetical protein